MANKQGNTATPTKTRVSLPAIARPILKVNFFQDELAAFGVDENTSYGEASTLIRQAAGVPVPMRRKSAGAGISALAAALRDASPEKRAEIMEILSSKDDVFGDEDEDE